ncbi:hypothetical protein LCGC14_1295020 [marine sediment metagenome]|uniref:Uncharacterized protein n=1 Tax=marine sediment metagenome TaxID=412755 RepID=A0A0F9KT19_9ZZZZ
MSETKHTPLPWRAVQIPPFKLWAVKAGNNITSPIVAKVGTKRSSMQVLLQALGETGEANAQLIVTSVNARPRVEELLEAARFVIGEFVEMSDGRIEDTPKGVQQLSRAAREVEAALKGEA